MPEEWRIRIALARPPGLELWQELMDDPSKRKRTVAERLYRGRIRWLGRLEHRQLQLRPVEPRLLDLGARHRLHDVVDVTRPPVHVRPERHVHLVGLHELRDERTRALEQRPRLERFRILEVGDVDDVAPRLDEQRPDAER